MMKSISKILAVGCLAYLTSFSTYAAENIYSHSADANYPNRVFWGDTHLHTTNSLDARAKGVTLDAADAYRFARGDKVTTTTGIEARLARPLDFLVVTDHSDVMGAFDQLIGGNPDLLKYPVLRELHDAFQKGAEADEEDHSLIFNAVISLLGGEYSGPLDPLLDKKLFRSVWEDYVETADKYNDPGRFTALIGYEWTPSLGGDKLHRNVLYRGGAEKAKQMLPFTATESINPQDLWAWMARYESNTGGNVLALAHNGNLSWGQMFPVETHPKTGKAIDAEYVKNRARWEPLYEVTQFKGDSEAHPFLSPNDEFADFETWDRGNASLQKKTTPDMHQYEYAREALKNGLKLERKLGSNPYQFGMVGSTDTHTSLSTADENYFFGKFVDEEPGPGRMEKLAIPNGQADMWMSWEYNAAGYAAVWATENTREAIWDAMKRKEVYATTGPRITLRFFGGWGFSESDASAQMLASVGYQKGVPMGGTIQAIGKDKRQDSSKKQAPTFLVGAMKDPMSGHLDRVQIIKGWLDSEGNTHEKIYDVVWGDAHRRQLDKKGKLPAIGNTVNVAEATWINSIGDAELTGFWQDPDFDASESAVYYVRVLEIPTPRWTAYDAKFTGEEPPPGTPMTLQERAYSSPIWYIP